MIQTTAFKRRWLAVAAVCWVWALACSSEPVTCGAGTVAKGSACVPATTAVTCGSGTVAVNGQCVATDAGSAADGGAATADGAVAGDGSADTVGPAEDATAVCVPQCTGYSCGDDGCGGSCGTCTTPAKPNCNKATHQCEGTCVPKCSGKDCGDDGCGGQCGTCAADLACDPIGRCVPPAWKCAPAYYNGGADPCDCGCGAPDPDCKNPGNPTAGCTSLESCDAGGKCVSKAAAGWTCAASLYNGLDNCDCGCGAPDPDCKYDLPLSGCKAGETCSATGSCVACTPKCDGKACGEDGCGGSCGTCKDDGKPVCVAGQCVAPCTPTPALCATNKCGPDGCGGSCGTCPAGSACQAGDCVAVELPSAPTSCVGFCGSTAPAGCYCVAACAASGTCCADYKAACGCKPQCAGKQCGADGCGGSCGTCGADKPSCDSAQQCTATCTKQCDKKQCGADGCGGSCGSCGADASCSSTQHCVPTLWSCAKDYFADGQVCDCGCGAPDPDCADPKAPVFGCPGKGTACGTNGICQATFCGKNAECNGKWCVGLWPAGGGLYKGVCGNPIALAKAPGESCFSAGECATGACVEGLCATHCQADFDCPETQRCLGGLMVGQANFALVGYAGVCKSVPGSAAACTKQASCAGGEVCHPFVDPVTLAPRWLCTTGSKAVGPVCYTAGSCKPGLFCALQGLAGTCTVACPGGAAECPTATTCSDISLHATKLPGFAGDPKVPLCVPK